MSPRARLLTIGGVLIGVAVLIAIWLPNVLGYYGSQFLGGLATAFSALTWSILSLVLLVGVLVGVILVMRRLQALSDEPAPEAAWVATPESPPGVDALPPQETSTWQSTETPAQNTPAPEPAATASAEPLPPLDAPVVEIHRLLCPSCKSVFEHDVRHGSFSCPSCGQMGHYARRAAPA